MTNEFKVYAAKRYMEHVGTVRNSVAALEGEIEALRASLTGLRAIQYTDMPGSPNAYGDAIPDGIARLEDHIGRYMTELAEWLEVQYEAHQAIKRLEDGRHKQLLWAHFVDQDSWEQIAVDMSYSYEYVRKELYESALESLYGTMPEEWRRNFPRAEV